MPDPTPGVPAAFVAYIDRLTQACHAHPDVIGLVLMGSTASQGRADEWSDHDFAVICRPGTQPMLRADLSWLPDAGRICAVAHEHHGGLKAIYDTGAVLEFAVVDPSELRTFYANDYRVAYDDGDIATVMAEVRARTVPGDMTSAADKMALFLSALLIGVGRDRRGEHLTAMSSVQGLAVDNLLALIWAFIPSEVEVADTLDPRRRFELAHPRIGAELAPILHLPTEECARRLLAVARTLLAPRWSGYPLHADEIVCRRLGWWGEPAHR